MSKFNVGHPPWQLSDLRGVLEGTEEQVGAYPWEKGVQVPLVCVCEASGPGHAAPARVFLAGSHLVFPGSLYLPFCL